MGEFLLGGVLLFFVHLIKTNECWYFTLGGEF